MIKALINFRGIEVLGKEEQKSIIGKGKNTPPQVGACADGDWAPIGANPANYPNYPCAHIIGEVPCLPTFLPDGTILEC
ncbi:hypothetical protein AR687_07705 [Flavobacteriaceae bacterium CRH]|nr:hypothetical protein AR687_07705 [Flavobacteriaceae bacterium CRH]